MNTNHCLKLNELRVVLHCRRMITLMLVTEELSKPYPDFENDMIEQSKADLKQAGDDIAVFIRKFIDGGAF
jgi:hypothetical protein